MTNRDEQPTNHQNPLTKRQLKKRQKLAMEVIKNYQQAHELADGYALSFPRSKAWASKLTEFIDGRSGHSFFTTELIFEENRGPIWLKIRGGKGAKEYIEEALSSDVKIPSFTEKATKLGFRVLTNPIRLLPDFLIIGAAKCGTTSLHSYLIQHPCVGSTYQKEIYFFDRHFKRSLSWYRAHFPTVIEKYHATRRGKEGFLVGEATPCYIFGPHVPKRVFRQLPKIKLIALLRNPIDTAHSYYNMKVRYGYESLSFEQAIDKEEERLNGELEKMRAHENYFSFNRQHYSYLSRGIYIDQLKNWLNFFPEDQLLILKSEDFYNDPSETFNRVTSFLNLPSWEPTAYKKLNAALYQEMKETTRKRLIRYFEPHNQRLSDFFGVDFGWDQ